MSNYIDELLEGVGKEDAPPLPPEGGIPRQWVVAPIRNFFRILLFPFVWLDLGAQSVARLMIRPPYKQVGKCKKRGNCCHYILIRGSKYFPAWLDLFWHTQINGFFRRDKRAHDYNGMKMYVMGCRHLKKDGSCGSYRLRPMICRTWPRIEYFGYPQVLKGCGFKAVLRKPKKGLPIID